MPRKKDPADNQPFLPTTVVRYEIPETKPGYPWMELYCALIAAASYLCCGIVQSYTSGAIYSIQTDVDSHIILSKDNISWIASAPPLSALVGTVMVGPMMEKLGRKRTITLLSVPFIVGWMIIGVSVNFTMIIIGRLVTGLAFGMARAVAPLYVSETARSQHRGKLGFLPPIMSAVGVLVGCMLGTSMNWKQLAICMAFLPVLLLLSSLYLPETPHWLISQNQEDQAFQALKKLRHQRGNVNDDDLRLYKEIQEIRETMESRSVTAAEYDHIHEEESFLGLLKQPSIRRPAVLVFLLMIFQQFSGVSAIIYYMKIILNHGIEPITSSGGPAFGGPPHPPPVHHLDIRSTIIGIVHICAFFITLPLVDRVGRRILLIISGILMALSHLLLAYYFFVYCAPLSGAYHLFGSSAPNTEPLGVSVRRNVPDKLDINNMTGPPTIPPPMSSLHGDDLSQLFSSVHSWLPLLSLCAYITAFSIASPVPYILMSEMFSLTVRGYLCSAATLICNISSFIIIFLFPPLMYNLSPVFTFVLFALFSLQNSLIGFIIPETKGKSLAEIENLFRGPRDFHGKVTSTIEVPECAILDVAMEIAVEAKSHVSQRQRF